MNQTKIKISIKWILIGIFATIYDMCKAMDKKMVIENTFLMKKTGGKSGEFNFYK